MPSSEEDAEMGFQHPGSGSVFNKSSSGSGVPFGSNLDPIKNYPVGAETHQGLVPHYQSSSAIGDLVGSFGSGCFSETLTNLNQPGPCSSPNNKRRFNPNTNEETENGDKKRMKEVKDDSDSVSAPKDTSYVHVRAKRGQATNSHSLAERVRRERISERMKLLQDLVPGCNKITGKAVMLDEIINYVQSLQQQVEFLSMKLATVNPEVNIDIDRLVFKDIFQSCGSNPTFSVGPALSSSHSFSHVNLHGIQSPTPTMHPIHPQHVWDNDLHNLLQMGFDVNTGINNVGPNGEAKMKL